MKNWIETFRRRHAQRKRAEAVAAGLPEAMDLWVLVMEAGLDFQVALAHYLDRAPASPLRDELTAFQAELQTGTSRLDALQHLAQRVDHPDVRETVRAIRQSLELGSALSPVLRAQSRALRQRRAYAAEKQAALTPLKLLFPLFVFIFPTLFIILFGPVALAVMKGKGL